MIPQKRQRIDAPDQQSNHSHAIQAIHENSVYTGILSDWNVERNYGFINAPGFEKVIYVDTSSFESPEVAAELKDGAVIFFSPRLDEEGKCEAVKSGSAKVDGGVLVQPSVVLSELTSQTKPLRDIPTGRVVASVRRFNKRKGFGFVQHKNLTIFVHKKNITGRWDQLVPKVQLEMNVVIDVDDEGKPRIQGRNVSILGFDQSLSKESTTPRPISVIVATQTKHDVDARSAVMKSHYGVVQRWDQQRGFGHIECKNIKGMIYVHHSQVLDKKVLLLGDVVQIKVDRPPGSSQAIAKDVRILHYAI